VFSTTPVNVTFAHNSVTSTSKAKSGVTQKLIIGVSVSGGLLLIFIVAAVFLYYRKRQGGRRMKQLKSPLDARFGATNITSPNNGAYGNPYASPPITVAQDYYNHESLSSKERHVLGMDVPIALERPPRRQASKRQEATPSPPLGNHLPPYSPPSIPTHKAYITDPFTSPFTSPSPDSPATTNNSDNAYQMSNYSSPRPSPPGISPPLLRMPQNEGASPPIQLSSSSVHTQYTQPRKSPPINPISPANSHLSGGSRNGREKGHRITSKLGVGNANASNDQTNLQISRPIVDHGPRFDFEFAQREMREQELQYPASKKKRSDATPVSAVSSAVSEELWPGAY